MPSPFPGMDPFLEAPHNWRSFHHLLADSIMASLNQVLSRRYYADVEVRTVMGTEEIVLEELQEIRPDAAVLEVAPEETATDAAIAIAVLPAPLVRSITLPDEVKLRSVHVRRTEDRRLVTAIELLSPTNKRGQGLEAYQQKRQRLLLSPVHFIEVDLLRAGERPGWEVQSPPIDTDYVVLVNRADGQRFSEIWPVALNEPLPTIPVPLLPPDPDVPLDLTAAVVSLYQRAVYDRRIDYSQPVPPPPLRPAMADWWAERQRQRLQNESATADE